MNPVFRFILNRLREPSSWAGLAILVTQAGYTETLADALTAWLAASVALVAVILPTRRD